MSRSRKKSPFSYMVSGCNKDWFRSFHRQWRRMVKQRIRFDEYLPTRYDEVEDIWCAPSDGRKAWFDPSSEWVKKWMRKK
jgi:hypothetical protein